MTREYGMNVHKYYLFKFCTGLMLFGSVTVPFFTEWGKLSFTQIMLLQSWFMFCIVMLEIPTGAVADYLGRKYTIAVGALLCVAAVVVYTSIPNFYVFMIGETLWAASTAILSGADQAFIYDSLKALNREEESKIVFGRAESFMLAGLMTASPIGSILASVYGTRLMVLATAIPFMLAAVLALTFKEPEITEKKGRENYLKVLKEGIGVIFKSKVLKILALDMISLASIGYFMIWMFQPMLEQVGIGIEYYGFVHMAFIAAEIVIINNFARLERLVGSKKRFLFLSAVITGVTYALGGLAAIIPVTLTAIVIGGGFGMTRKVLMLNYMNKFIPSEQRATAISVVSTLNNLVLVVVNPFFGRMMEWSLNYTLIILGIVAVIFALVSRVEEEHLLD